MTILKLIRVHQWIKNMFVFLPVFFSGEILNWEANMKSTISFFLFSFAASSVYVINDYLDAEKDKHHQIKKSRPIASGKIKKSQAIIILIICITITILIGAISISQIGTPNSKTAILLVLTYFIINIAYSFKLKHIAIIDVIIIAIGFVLRVMVGGQMSGIPVSEWTILLVFMLALVLSLEKRRQEMVNLSFEVETRKSLGGYNLEFTNIALSVIAAVTIMCYIMFTLSPETQEKFHQANYFTVIFVIAGVLRYLQLALVYNQTESPTKIIYKDPFLQLVIFVWILSFGLLIYFKNLSIFAPF